ncbi:MAG: nitroreductase family protein [Candidatus Woesearchaeota archaeon]
MDFEEVVRKRRSVREYENKEITDAQLKKLFDLVRFTPSAYNLQPWEFIIVRDSERKNALRECTPSKQQHVENAGADIIILGNKDPEAYLDEIKADEAKRARVKLLTSRSEQESERWTQRDGSLAAMTLMLAAQSMGLSTCPIGAFDADKVRKEFSIPEKFEIVLVVTLGYGKNIPEAPNKRSVESIMHFEKL